MMNNVKMKCRSLDHGPYKTSMGSSPFHQGAFHFIEQQRARGQCPIYSGIKTSAEHHLGVDGLATVSGADVTNNNYKNEQSCYRFSAIETFSSHHLYSLVVPYSQPSVRKSFSYAMSFKVFLKILNPTTFQEL